MFVSHSFSKSIVFEVLTQMSDNILPAGLGVLVKVLPSNCAGSQCSCSSQLITPGDSQGAAHTLTCHAHWQHLQDLFQVHVRLDFCAFWWRGSNNYRQSSWNKFGLLEGAEDGGLNKLCLDTIILIAMMTIKTIAVKYPCIVSQSIDLHRSR